MSISPPVEVGRAHSPHRVRLIIQGIGGLVLAIAATLLASQAAAQAQSYSNDPFTQPINQQFDHRYDPFNFSNNHSGYHSGHSSWNNSTWNRPILINPIGNSWGSSSDCLTERRIETRADGSQVEVIRSYGGRCSYSTPSRPSIQFSIGSPYPQWNRPGDRFDRFDRSVHRVGHPINQDWLRRRF